MSNRIIVIANHYYNKDVNIEVKNKKVYPSADEQCKTEIRGMIRECPELYYVLKNSIKRRGSYRFAYGDVEKEYLTLKHPEILKARKDARDKRANIESAHAARETQAELREWQLSRLDNAVQCPYCKSWDTDKISTASRVASVAMVGVASGKIGKEWHCNKCGSNF